MKSRTSSTPSIGRRRKLRVSLRESRARIREQDAVGAWNRIPGATYRLQFNARFSLEQAREALDYLRELGVTDVYCSPLLQAGPESTHGYDTCCCGKISETLGGDDAFEKFSAALRERGMGLLLDIVPNHMAAHEMNAWWWDVLKHGQRSRFAKFFDIDRGRGGGRVILPVLGDDLQKVRAASQLVWAIDEENAAISYFGRRFPLSPRSLLTKDLLARQHYELVHWKRGPREINYRRFFDVNELAALRIEDAEVFRETHRRVFDLVRGGHVHGLRVDHPDGLRDPAGYFRRLQAHARKAGQRFYVVVEKILSGDESLPREWPVAGTTGYDFLNDVNGLFVAKKNEAALTNLYHEFTGCTDSFEDVAYRSKKRVLHKLFIGDVQALADRLTNGSGANSDLLCAALIELISCFPVYRTYVRERTRRLSAADLSVLKRAFVHARLRAPQSAAEFDVLEKVLLLQWTKPARELREFVMRFQQLTGPAAAKGIEDTAFYRFHRLVSLNEVGGDPAQFGVDVETFHRRNLERARNWPHTLLATATHDTKRGEDVRARVNVLSEIPGEWRAAVLRWREINRRHKTDVNGAPAPDANDEYLFYQTLIGTWTAEGSTEIYRQRIADYMLKAIKESKRHTSWTEPNEAYEKATRDFIERVLAPVNGEFLGDFVEFQQRTAFFGVFNSLSQTVLKLTSPGVPDIYQGTELWDFSLVDPDNRRPVDYALRRELLGQIRAAAIPHLVAEARHGGVKLFLIQRVLEVRNHHRDLFDHGKYVPLETRGAASQHVCAFGRVHDGKSAVIIAPRFICTLLGGQQAAPIGAEAWGDTEVLFPRNWPKVLRANVLTGECVEPAGAIRMSDALSAFPVALLKS
jgi:(1->4)-alpha-D-glucan 1-alpha-D-glucosylmutase